VYGGAGSVSIGNPGVWTITNNVFPDGVPPLATDPSNVATNPQLAAPAVAATPEAFRPSTSSPCRHAGKPVASVPLDFACATRGTVNTTIGAFE
jgi:hypothetical protein